jgi:hypothetical protein
MKKQRLKKRRKRRMMKRKMWWLKRLKRKRSESWSRGSVKQQRRTSLRLKRKRKK